MDKRTAVNHALSGFSQALGWTLGTAFMGLLFALMLHPIGLVAVALLIPAVLIVRRSRQRRQQPMTPPQQSPREPPAPRRLYRQIESRS